MDAAEGMRRRWSEAHSGALLLATGASVAADSIWPMAITGLLGLGVLVGWRRHFGQTGAPFGVANTVTVARVLVTFALAAFLCRRPWWSALTGAGVLLADAVDGALARRLKQASDFGAQLDMEADAYFILMLCAVLVFGVGVGPWGLFPGVVRYAFVVVRWAHRPVDVPERRSPWGRVIFLGLSLSLLAVLGFHSARWPWPALYAATAALTLSFVPDFQLTLRAARAPATATHRALWWALPLGAQMLLFVPGLVFQDSPRHWAVLGSLSFEFLVAAGLVMLAAHTRLKHLARVAALVLWALFALFLTYHQGYAFFFLRQPALGEDWRLSLNLVHFLSDEWSAHLTVFALAGATTAVLGLRWAWRILGQLQARALEWRPGQLLKGLAVLLSVAALGLWATDTKGWAFGVKLLSRLAADNYLTSLDYAGDMGALAQAAPDLSYERLLTAKLKQRPNVYLLMIEAYGGALVTCDTRQAYASLMTYAQERLAAKGYHARTAYSRAPVHSGGSWKSIATVETGIHIERNTTFELLERTAARLPTLSGFFREQGYQTLALQPGSTDRTGLRRYDMYRRHVNIGGPELAYKGPTYVFVGTPDQYSVGFFLDNALPKVTAPYFVYYMSVSTHYDWWTTPPFVTDWRALNDRQANLASLTVPWKPLAGVENISERPQRLYFDTVQYEWRVLLEMIEREASDDAIFFILGDHQPRLSCAPATKSFETPVHVISKSEPFLQRFDALGFAPGLYAKPAQNTPLLHEGFFSMVVSKMTEQYGEMPAQAPSLYFPNGIGHAGLLR
ncbi:MAG: CDP-alcohol phosphatidyltransferase family protein [Myxococcaceae bacterium]|nr:CDP-alcohol phosphatidyltransferase family protein [Myxococcaceae bacterium]